MKKKQRRAGQTANARKKLSEMLLIVCVSVMVAGISLLLILNGIVLGATRKQICDVTPQNGYEIAVILGARVHEGGRLSDMLYDRMYTAVMLYQEGKVSKLLLSGDGSGEWSEVKYMKIFALENGVPEEDILEDPEGYSTYETMSRAKEVYGLNCIVAVTQKYHLYRAIYIAQDFGMQARGASADLDFYVGQIYWDFREAIARIKDFGLCLFNG